MMITIHGLPATTKYQELKAIIKQQCNIGEFILDSLLSDQDGTKKVRVGLADDVEGAHVIKCLDGFRMLGNILRVVPVGKSVPPAGQIQSSLDLRENFVPRNDFPNQGFNRGNLEPVRPAWTGNNSQWTPNQPAQIPNAYNYQQPQVNTPFGHQGNMPPKPQLDPREIIEMNRAQQQNQGYGFNPKSNLISLSGGPPRNVSSNLRDIPEVTRPMPGRYANQNYDTPAEKPITIMKDNFQGPSQYNVTPTQGPGYQGQAQSNQWSSQQQPKQFDKSSASFDKKPYGDRTYPSNQMKMTDMPSKLDQPYKGYDKNRQFSPPRRPYDREMPERRVLPSDRDGRNVPGRRVSPSGRVFFERSSLEKSAISGRVSPNGRRMSPSGRFSGKHVSPPGRRNSPGRRVSPSERRFSPSGRRLSPSGRRLSPSGRRISPSGRRISPSGRPIGRDIPQGRRFSPSGRRISPSGKPIGRDIPQGRRFSPSGRRISPSGRPIGSDIPQGRRFSPSGRRISPSGRPIGRDIPQGRRFSPSGRPIRDISPGRKISPTRKEDYVHGGRMSQPLHAMDRRRPSPTREVARGMQRHESYRGEERYSPTHDRPHYEDGMTGPSTKIVRPAYEPHRQASDEAMYSSGYRPKVREDEQYSSRPNWEDREKQFPPKNYDDGRDVILRKFESAREKLLEQSGRSRSRASRSPRRDRSPMRDRVRRNSPSPRSPRRSWALEKRQSPEQREPPPPPMWPGSETREDHDRPRFHERVLEKTSAIWLPKEKRDQYSSADKRREYEDLRMKKEAAKWRPISQTSPHESSSRFGTEFGKKDFEDRREHRRDTDFDRQDHADHYKADYDRKVEVPRKKEEYSGRILEKKKEILHKQGQLEKEIDEVYKRAVDFTKKAELYKKGEHRNDDRRRQEDHGSRDYDKRFKQDSFDVPGRSELSKYSSRNDDLKKEKNIIKSRFDIDDHKRHTLNPTIKAKREKVIEEITEKILSKYGKLLPSDIARRVEAEMKWTLGRKVQDMFGDKDVSFIEMVIKFNTNYTEKDQERIFEEVMSSWPSQLRQLKRSSQDDSGPPAKSSRRSPEPGSTTGQKTGLQEQQIPDWDTNIATFNPMLHNVVLNQPGIIMNTPVMVPLPAQYQFVQPYQEMPQQVVEDKRQDACSLYLCKDDFTAILEYETDKLKEFLVQQLIKVTETSQGWAPDFTWNKQNSSNRQEVITRDGRSKDWLLSLDFSEFDEFNVLVYTSEELWYERAAVWLPGHSRCKHIEPLMKLKLQNKSLADIDIGKWKLVKKIVTDKGTRIYVDMPPSSARALEKHKMLLSYELQKVNVFLKADAVDKDAFDTGLYEESIKVLPIMNISPMPSLGQDPKIVKIGGKGNKPLSLANARKAKDIIIFKIFKYHKLDGKSRTDFVKFGVCQPGYLGILPENEESKKWLLALNLEINKHPLVIVGSEDRTKYFKMRIMLPKDHRDNVSLVTERLRQSNKGVKGLNFNLWNNPKIVRGRTKLCYEVEMDYQSVETIATNMNYILDYVGGPNIRSVDVESEYTKARFDEILAKYKAEMSDSYDVANMDLGSDDDDVICLD